jgi:hypothetical protein
MRAAKTDCIQRQDIFIICIYFYHNLHNKPALPVVPNPLLVETPFEQAKVQNTICNVAWCRSMLTGRCVRKEIDPSPLEI